jgi:hypothetical protein
MSVGAVTVTRRSRRCGVCRGVGGQVGAVGAAADREALGLLGEQRAVLRSVGHMDRDDATGGGFHVILCPGHEVNRLTGVCGERVTVVGEADEVVEVHGIEQAFDDGCGAVVHGA